MRPCESSFGTENTTLLATESIVTILRKDKTALPLLQAPKILGNTDRQQSIQNEIVQHSAECSLRELHFDLNWVKQ